MKKLSGSIYTAAVLRGFDYDNIPNTLMHACSELGEAFNAHRILDSTNGLVIENDISDFKLHFENLVKDTFEDEIADAMMILLGLCHAHNIDIEEHIRMKMNYNLMR